jgi:hypothetical protein
MEEALILNAGVAQKQNVGVAHFPSAATNSSIQ